MPGPLRHLTRRGVGLLVGAGGAWALGRLLAVDALWLVAVALLAVVVVGVGLVQITATTLDASRQVVPSRVGHGERVEVHLTLRNRSRVPTSLMTVRDHLPASLARSAASVLPPLGPGQVSRLAYRLVGHRRGAHEIGPVEVVVRDPFGIAARPLRAGGTDELVVYPRVHHLAEGLPLRGLAGGGGPAVPRPGLRGEEVATVREYAEGDDLRRVHWGSTAHRGELMVRQDESPQRPDTTLVVDVRASAHGSAPAPSSLETAASVAASVVGHVARRGFDTTLVTEPAAHRPRALGWEPMLERLARLVPGEADLDGAWRQLATTAGASGLLVAVVCVPEAALLRSMVRAGRGASVKVALLVDAAAHRAVEDTGGPLGRTRRGRADDAPDPARTARALRAAGWRVAVLGPGDDVTARWRELLASHPTARVAVRS